MFYTQMLAVAGRFAVKHPKISKSVAKHVTSNVDHQAKAHIQNVNQHAHASVNHATSELHNTGSRAKNGIHGLTSKLGSTLKSKQALLSKTKAQPPVITEAYARNIAGMTGLFAGHIK